MNRLVAYESRLELTGPDSSRDRRHVPDLLVVTVGSGVTVVDVKAMSRLRDRQERPGDGPRR
jgi:hypothetical protein